MAEYRLGLCNFTVVTELDLTENELAGLVPNLDFGQFTSLCAIQAHENPAKHLRLHLLHLDHRTQAVCWQASLGSAGSGSGWPPPTTFERCDVTFGGLTETSTAGPTTNGSVVTA